MASQNKANHIVILGASSDIAIPFIQLLFNQWEESYFHLLARNTTVLQPILPESRSKNNQVEIVAYDLLKPTNLHFSNITHCVVFAGWLPPNNNEADKSMQVNFTGVQQFVDTLIKDNQQTLQHIILTGSVAGVRVRPANKAYGQAKAALHQYAAQLQKKWSTQIAVTLVIPGYVNTKMIARHKTPAPLTLTPSEMANKYIHWMKTQPAIVYSQPIWQIISTMLKLVPEFVIKRMKA